MKKQISLLLIGVVVIILLSLVPSNKNGSTKISSETPYSSPAILEEKVPGTESWKTYKNDTYGFEFKYPAEFGDPNPHQFGDPKEFPVDTLKSCVHSEYSDMGLVSFKNIDVGLACPGVLENRYKGGKEFFLVDGKTAYLFDYISPVGFSNKEAYIPLSNGAYYLSIVHTTYEGGRPEKYLELSNDEFRKILSTLKFK
ncbi:MAG: hypothetical protein PHV93_00575 [Candidatus Pacebacteria bacterium]|nr:hypothetical protein [Candidatus Paceibacterota bacterium]